MGPAQQIQGPGIIVLAHRIETEGVPAGGMVLEVLQEIGPVPSTIEPGLDAGFLGR